MSELSPLHKKIEKVMDGNKAAIERLDKIGFDVTGIRDNKTDFLVNFLVKQGIIDEGQALEYKLEWETHLSDNLVNLERQAKVMLDDIRKKALAHDKKQRERLAVPRPAQLIVPGQPGRGRRAVRDNPQA